MDDTICDFRTPFLRDMTEENKYPHSRTGFFMDLEPIPGALEALSELRMLYDVYILTKPSFYNIHCYTEKAMWIQKHMGFDMLSRLILSPDKSLLKGDFLVDDAQYDGQTEFEGTFMQFGTERWPGWKEVKNALVDFHFGREHGIYEIRPCRTTPLFPMQPRLMKYSYQYECQGTDEWGVEYAMVFVPEDATFNNARSVLVNKRDRPNHKIQIETVEDITIQY